MHRSNANTDHHAGSYGDPYSYCDGNCNCNCDRNSNSNSYIHSNSNTSTEGNSYSKAPANTAVQALVGNITNRHIS